MTNGATMSIPFDVCERFIDRLLGMFPNLTRSQAKQYVSSIDEVVTIAETKVETLIEQKVLELEKKLEPKIRLEIKESDLATGKDILILDNKIDLVKKDIELVSKDIESVSKNITILMWMLGTIIAIVGVAVTILSLKH